MEIRPNGSFAFKAVVSTLLAKQAPSRPIPLSLQFNIVASVICTKLQCYLLGVVWDAAHKATGGFATEG